MRAIARLVRGLDAGYHRIQRGKVAAQQRHAQLCRSFATVIRLVQSDWKIFVKPRSAPSTRAPSRSDVNANYMWPAQFKRLIAGRWRSTGFGGDITWSTILRTGGITGTLRPARAPPRTIRPGPPTLARSSSSASQARHVAEDGDGPG